MQVPPIWSRSLAGAQSWTVSTPFSVDCFSMVFFTSVFAVTTVDFPWASGWAAAKAVSQAFSASVSDPTGSIPLRPFS